MSWRRCPDMSVNLEFPAFCYNVWFPLCDVIQHLLWWTKKYTKGKQWISFKWQTFTIKFFNLCSFVRWNIQLQFSCNFQKRNTIATIHLHFIHHCSNSEIMHKFNTSGFLTWLVSSKPKRIALSNIRYMVSLFVCEAGGGVFCEMLGGGVPPRHWNPSYQWHVPIRLILEYDPRYVTPNVLFCVLHVWQDFIRLVVQLLYCLAVAQISTVANTSEIIHEKDSSIWATTNQRDLYFSVCCCEAEKLEWNWYSKSKLQCDQGIRVKS